MEHTLDISEISLNNESEDNTEQDENAEISEDNCLADDETYSEFSDVDDELIDETEVLNLHKKEYPKICESMDKIFEEYLGKLTFLENMENENICKQNEKIKEEMKKNIKLLDSTINKIHNEIECVKQKTKQIQVENRARLAEIIASGPPESQKLAKNTKEFMELGPKDVAKFSEIELSETSEPLPTVETSVSETALKLVE